MPPIPLLISAGEASGDMYAARLARALAKRMDVSLFGMGGPAMREAGVDVVQDYAAVSVVGITEILRHLPSLVRAMRRMVEEARRRKPVAAISTDFPGFHLRLARKLGAMGVPNIYYICPQFWAWRPWRANLVRRRFALGLCIFPFEEKFYADAGARVRFIGHPLVGAVAASLSREQFAARLGLAPGHPVIALLPGSRMGEISRNLPLILASAAELQKIRPGGYNFVVALAPGVAPEQVRKFIPDSVSPVLVQGDTYNALAAADVSIVCSGTATVEAALLDAPMVVVYKVAALTALVARPLVRTRHFAMVNLVAGRRVVPEFIQGDFEPGRVAEEVRRLLDPEAAAAQRSSLARVRALLGPPGAVERAADLIAALLQSAGSPPGSGAGPGQDRTGNALPGVAIL